MHFKLRTKCSLLLTNRYVNLLSLLSDFKAKQGCVVLVVVAIVHLLLHAGKVLVLVITI